MAWTDKRSVAYDDEDVYDKMKSWTDGPTVPEYPPNLQFSISEDDLEKVGAEDGEPGDLMHFSAMGEVTSIFRDSDNARIELELTQFAGDDGKFIELETPSHICLCGSELEKMGLEADCERGDMIHLIGTARLESCSSTEYGGDMACLQITELTFEDESDESRDGG